MKKPVVFKYTDYRRYLSALYRRLKKADPSLTSRKLSSLMGARSPSYGIDVIRGRQNLYIHNMIRMCRKLNLTSKETEYLECLLHHNNAKNKTVKRYYSSKLKKYRL